MDISKLQTPSGSIKIAAMDHRGSLKKLLPQGTDLSDFKDLLTQTFAPYSSAILVDPEYGQAAIESAKDLGVALMLTREETGYSDNPDGRVTELYKEFDSKRLKEMGADAVKILLFYNSKAPNKNDQLEVIKKVREETLTENLPFLVEPIAYEIKGVKYNKGEETLKAVADLTSLCDILKIEYPVGPEESEVFIDDGEDVIREIASIITVPWVLLSKGMKFDDYVKAIEVCKQYGCAGYAVGRGVWQEVSDQPDWASIENFIKTTALDRMKELSEKFDA